MKKIIIFFILIALLSTGCQTNKNNVNYSEYPFVNKIWTRNGDHDIETIVFYEDGSFSYYCSCGNPVNDSDLCEEYIYNDKTKEIKFDYIETTEETLKIIKIVEMSEIKLKLDFNGEIREFKKENNLN